MNIDEKIIAILKENKVKQVITVPCKFFATLLEKMKEEPSIRLIWPAREEEGLGISAGSYLGGARSILMIQNSGLGNMVNAIKSLNEYYDIPFFAIVSHRGGDSEKIEAQKPVGRITTELLNLLGIRHETLSVPGDVDKIGAALKEFFTKKENRVLLLQASFWRDAK